VPEDVQLVAVDVDNGFQSDNLHACRKNYHQML